METINNNKDEEIKNDDIKKDEEIKKNEETKQDEDLDKSEYTPLMLAVNAGNNESVKTLLKESTTKINFQISNGLNALIIACEKGLKEIVALLLAEPNIDVNLYNESKFTALFMACMNEHKEIVELLLKHPNINVHVKDHNENTAFFAACYGGNKDICEMIFKRLSPFDINKPNKLGSTPLMVACENGNKELIDWLLQFPGIDINILDKVRGFSALMMACSKAHKEVVELLLKQPKINIHIQDEDKRDALGAAIGADNKEIVEMILKKDEKLASRALLQAASKSSKEIIEMILTSSFPFDVNYQNELGRTALILGCLRENVEIVEMLLKHPNINVNLAEGYGFTALILAAQQGNLQIIEMLLKHPNIDINFKSRDGRNALMSAAMNKCQPAAELLWKKVKLSKKEETKTYQELQNIGQGEGAFLLAKIAMGEILGEKVEKKAKDYNEKDIIANSFLGSLKSGIKIKTYYKMIMKELLSCMTNLLKNHKPISDDMLIILWNYENGKFQYQIYDLLISICEEVFNPDKSTPIKWAWFDEYLLNSSIWLRTDPYAKYQSQTNDSIILFDAMKKIALKYNDVICNKLKKDITNSNIMEEKEWNDITSPSNLHLDNNNNNHHNTNSKYFNKFLHVNLQKPEQEKEREDIRQNNKNLIKVVLSKHNNDKNNNKNDNKNNKDNNSNDDNNNDNNIMSTDKKILDIDTDSQLLLSSSASSELLSSSSTMDLKKYYNNKIYLPKLLLHAYLINNTVMKELNDIFEPLKKEKKLLEFNAGPIKNLERCQEKVEVDYMSDIYPYPQSSKLLDIVRCSAIFSNLNNLFYGLNYLYEYINNNHLSSVVKGIVRIKNGFENFNINEPDYSDIKLNILVECKYTLMIVEIQFLLLPFLKSKKYSHHIYSTIRSEEVFNYAKLFLDVISKPQHQLIEGTVKNNKNLVARALVKCDVNFHTPNGYTALGIATLQGNNEIAELLLQQPNIDINLISVDGFNPLLLACKSGNAKVAELLIERKNINLEVSIDGTNPLMFACINGHKEVVEILLKRLTISVNARNPHGITALMGACSKGYSEIVELLIKHPYIDLNILDLQGNNALDHASSESEYSFEHKKIVQMLSPKLRSKLQRSIEQAFHF